MEFDLTRTTAAFVGIIAVATLALIGAPMMTVDTILMMVVPSMVVFGLLTLALGVKYGEYRATAGR